MTRTRMGIAIGIAAVLAATFVAGAQARSHRTAAEKPLLIGISLSLSGDFSDPGKAAMRGYQLWAQEVNKHGGVLGRKVKLKIVDDASSPNQVVTNYQSLISRDKVDLVFGPFSTLLTAPAARVASRYHYAFVEPAGGGPSVFAEHLGNVFFVQPAPVAQQRRRVRALHPLAARLRAAEDGRVSVARRPVLLTDHGPHARPVREGRDQDGVQDHLPAGDRRSDAHRRPRSPPPIPTWSWPAPSRPTRIRRSRP